LSSQGLQKAAVQPNNLKKVLAARWQGGNYSSRIWANKEKLSGLLKRTITTGLHRGLSVPKMSKLINDKMNAGISNAERLVRTEMNFVQNHAAKDSLQAAGLDEYEFIAVLDSRTTPHCQSLNGKIFLVEEYSVGTNAPPMHPRCRSTICAVLGEITAKRTAKNSKGENIQIPADMNYSDYKKVYIDRNLIIEQWEKNNLANSLINSNSNIKIQIGSVTSEALKNKIELEFLNSIKTYDLLSKTDAQRLAQVNPNYLTGEYEWTHNCLKCVIAWELLNRGYNVTAKPYSSNDLINGNAIAAWEINGNFLTDSAIKIVAIKAWFKSEIQKSFEDWGQNARVAIFVEWKSGEKHTFTARKLKEKIIYEDPQMNIIRDIDETLEKCTDKHYRLWFMRIDNRNFTGAIKDAVEFLEG